MVKNELSDIKKWYRINLNVHRSNPVIFRQLYITSDRTLSDLAELCCISVGLPGADFILEEKMLVIKKQDKQLADCLGEDAGLKLIFTTPGKKLRDTDQEICLLLKVDAITERPAGGEQEPPTLPFISMAAGRNIPQKLKSLKELNGLQQAFYGNEYCDMGDGRYYSAKESLFSLPKTENSIRRYFAPETAVREINHRYGMPLKLLLEKNKMGELKGIADFLNIYYDSTVRKPGLIDSLYTRILGKGINSVFSEMSVSEFYDFKSFVLSEDPEKEGNNWEQLLPELFYRGLLLYVPKLGHRIASEVLDFYEDWYGTEKETEFIYGKYMLKAVTVAVRLYGIFTKEQFKYLVKKVSPVEIPEASADEYFDKVKNGFFISDIGGLNDSFAYHCSLLNQREADNLLKNRYSDTGLFFEPTEKQINRLYEKGLSLSASGEKALMSYLNDYCYFSYYDTEDIKGACRRIVNELHKCGDAEAACKRAENEMRRLSWSRDKDRVMTKIKAILVKEADALPLISLNGFSRNNCPAEILEHEKALREAADSKKKTAVKKTAVKKAAARTVAVKRK